MRTLPKTSLAKRGKSGSCSACPIAVFLFWLNSLANCKGQVVMLHVGNVNDENIPHVNSNSQIIIEWIFS